VPLALAFSPTAVASSPPASAPTPHSNPSSAVPAIPSGPSFALQSGVLSAKAGVAISVIALETSSALIKPGVFLDNFLPLFFFLTFFYQLSYLLFVPIPSATA
jgi:hypothetical protein